jgi:hypothetical protein
MNKIMVIRFGKPIPLPKEHELVESEICPGNPEGAMGAPMNGAIVSVFMTDKSAREVSKLFHDLAIKTNDELPTVVQDLETGEIIIDLQGQPGAHGLLKHVGHIDRIDPHETEPACYMTLDQLLDKVRDHGQSSLTPVELKRLQELSK